MRPPHHSLALHLFHTTNLTSSILGAHLRFHTESPSLKLTLTPYKSRLSQHSHTYDNDIRPPRSFRPLFDIYQELDKLECHFSNLDTGYTSNLDLDNPHTDLEEPMNVEEVLQIPNADY